MKLNALDLNKIPVFCAVVKHSGYRGASEELNLTRSAISQSISSLEGMLGVTLFHRVGNRILPTEHAKLFYRNCLQYQQGLSTSVSQLIGEDQNLQGVFRLGAYLEFAKSKLMPVIEEFAIRYPQIQIKFVFDSPSRLEKWLEDDKIDLAVSIFPHRGIKTIVCRKLFQEELVMVGHKDLVSENSKSEFLKNISILDYYSNHILVKRWWTLHFKTRMPKLFFRSYAATADMVFEMAKRRLGIGVVPKYLLESYSGSDLCVVQPTNSKLMDYIWLSEHQNLKKGSAAAVFSDMLKRRFASKTL